jgi:hypothetical protein
MPSFVSVFRAVTSEQLSPLIGLVESFLGRPIAAGITIRNLAAVPRTGHLYVYADAPAAVAVVRLFSACGLHPVSVVEADREQWGRMIVAATAGNTWRVVGSDSGKLHAADRPEAAVPYEEAVAELELALRGA